MGSSNECTWPEVKERAHYLCWLAAALGTAVLLGLTVDLLAVAVTGGVVGFGLVWHVYLSAIVPPLVYAWRKHGEAFCGFLELEHALDEMMVPRAAAASPWFAAVLAFIDRIDAAEGFERQLIRNEAKAWLLAHASKLSRDERDYIADHLGYLHRS